MSGYTWEEILGKEVSLEPNCYRIAYVGSDVKFIATGGGLCNRLKEIFKDNLKDVVRSIQDIQISSDIDAIIYNDLVNCEDIRKQINRLYPGQYKFDGKFMINMENYHKIILIRVSSIVNNLPTNRTIRKLEKVLKEKNLTAYYFEECHVDELDNLSEYEKKICISRTDVGNILSGDYDCRHQYDVFNEWDNDLKLLYGEKYSEEYIESIRSMRETKVIQKDGFPYRIGYSKYVNYANGHRYVVGRPNKYSKQVLVLGRSTILGGRMEDADTVPSQLQKNFNEQAPYIRVTEFSMGGAALNLFIEKIRKSDLNNKDIVILYWPVNSKLKKYFQNKNTYYRLKELVFDDRKEWKQGGEVFFDRTHYNALASKRIAEKTAEIILGNLNKQGVVESIQEKEFIPDKKFKKVIGEYKAIAEKNVTNGTIGAIVMHCNPFTFGHKYLIDMALQRTDFLYVFIVEEDHSMFSFKERLYLVKEQYKNERKINIMGSGKYMISDQTFPEYFDKANLQEEEINPIMDLSIFAKWIAPALNISVRFVGTEPNDKVTNQYNIAMKKILEEYGISVCEIERCKHGEEVISATKVRKLWEMQDYENLKTLVPPVTLDYLYGGRSLVEE